MASTAQPQQAQADFPSVESQEYWKLVRPGVWTCVLCCDYIDRDKRSAVRHEQSQMHNRRRSASLVTQLVFVDSNSLAAREGSNPSDLLQQHRPTVLPEEDTSTAILNDTSDVEPSELILGGSHQDEHSTAAPHTAVFLLNDGQLSNDDDGEWSNDDSEESEVTLVVTPATEETEWFPWPDKVLCTLDVLSHLPRSVYSDTQMGMFRWIVDISSTLQTPSVRVLKNMQQQLNDEYGIRTIAYKGVFGHNYFVNSLANIIAQEVSNPKIRPHLSFFPEDAGTRVEEYRHARHWRYEADPDKLTPAVTVNHQEFYVFELCLLQDGTVSIPHRYFVRGGALFAAVWLALPYNDQWVVHQYAEREIPVSAFAISFPSWVELKSAPHLPPPTRIAGILVSISDPQLAPWTFTEPGRGNRWRYLANGHQVYTFPIWLYCDDTSGNLSKKWNKHNSFLFTPAGLPRKLVHQESNVHFLCTSNTASPVEMLGGIVQQLERAWAKGIWAWDVQENRLVLIIPFVVALLGDNPMQSELAAHIGLNGTRFCRVCKASKNPLTDDEDQTDDDTPAVPPPTGFQQPISATGSGSEDTNDERSNPGSPLSDVSGIHQPSGTAKKETVESMSEMMSRIQRFVTIRTLRTKATSIKRLEHMYKRAHKIGQKTSVGKLKTQYGMKDGQLEHYMGKIFSLSKTTVGQPDRQKTLDGLTHTFPTNILDVVSPVWRIQGLDPHSDTPVEVLHVVLLGFVKYFWRDAIKLQLHKNDVKKKLLADRLSSFDTSGLGIPRLAGHTLVQYAGSLTGRDFRAIAQVAPFVLFDLVSASCYQAWLALGELVPLVWQHAIPDIGAYQAMLEITIRKFLAAVASWNVQWFNKPKFHILLHLVSHIARFGPSSLFATEAFESFNAVIRAKSVHSNRQAPSRDIAIAFAHGNRIRHALSGGHFKSRHSPPAPSGSSTVYSDQHGWRRAGELPLLLAAAPSIIRDSLGFSENTQQNGRCTTDSSPLRPYGNTKCFHYFPNAINNPSARRFLTCRSMDLHNGDTCTIGAWVLYQPPSPDGTFSHTTAPQIVQIVEILQEDQSHNQANSRPDAILVRKANTLDVTTPYNMPGVRLTDEYTLIPSIMYLLCSANVQHNCCQHDCNTITQRSQVLQPELPGRQEIQHAGDPEDRILNTARMRDSLHFQFFRSASLTNPAASALELLDAVANGVKNAIDSQKATEPAQPIHKTTRSHQQPRNPIGSQVVAPSPLGQAQNSSADEFSADDEQPIRARGTVRHQWRSTNRRR